MIANGRQKINWEGIKWVSHLTYPVGIVCPDGTVRIIFEEGTPLPTQKTGLSIMAESPGDQISVNAFQHYGENVKGLYGPKGNGYSAICDCKIRSTGTKDRFEMNVSIDGQGTTLLSVKSASTGEGSEGRGQALVTRLPSVDTENFDRYVALLREVMNSMLIPALGTHLNVVGNLNYGKLAKLRRSLGNDELVMFDFIVSNLLDSTNYSIRYLSAAVASNYTIKGTEAKVQGLITSGFLSDADLKTFGILKREQEGIR